MLLLVALLALLLLGRTSSGLQHSKHRNVFQRAAPRIFESTKDGEQNRLMRDLAEPLLDEKLIKDVIEAWTRPLPTNYLTSPLVLSGPSGVGKNRLISALLKDYNKFFKRVVTHTTRRPRPDEVNGTHYHFVDSKESFEDLASRDFFLERSEVHGNLYGISTSAFSNVTSAGKIPIFEIDVQGARKINALSKSHGLTPRRLFVAPVSIEALRSRLAERGTESLADVELRLANAVGEIAAAENEKGLFESVLVNSDFEEASKAFFRRARDFYPALPSPSRIRMLQRRITKIKKMGGGS